MRCFDRGKRQVAFLYLSLTCAHTRVTRPLGKPESRTLVRRIPHDWSRVHPASKRPGCVNDNRSASGGPPGVEGLRRRRTADCFPVGICVRSQPKRVIVSRFWPQEGHPHPAGSPLQLRVAPGWRRTPHDWRRVHPEPSDWVVLTALGLPPVNRPGMRVLPAADCFPVGISASGGQTRVTSEVEQHNAI